MQVSFHEPIIVLQASIEVAETEKRGFGLFLFAVSSSRKY